MAEAYSGAYATGSGCGDSGDLAGSGDGGNGSDVGYEVRWAKARGGDGVVYCVCSVYV